jgi:methylated-DNA-[protein]-cysteine S-methyltransferase
VTFYRDLDWPLGRLLLASDGEALTGLYFREGRMEMSPQADWRLEPEAEPFVRVVRQLQEYWAGARRDFDVPLRPHGTPFQERVWRVISGVPFGETISYGDLAARAGSPGASRAAGLATGRNPISIIVPCHRIVGTNGSLTGYGGGLPRKRALLEFEADVAGGARRRLETLPLFEPATDSDPSPAIGRR